MLTGLASDCVDIYLFIYLCVELSIYPVRYIYITYLNVQFYLKKTCVWQ